MQGILFLFYNAEPDDALVPVGDMDDLRKLVDNTKRGTGSSDDNQFADVFFDSVYEGSDELIATEVGKCTYTTHSYRY